MAGYNTPSARQPARAPCQEVAQRRLLAIKGFLVLRSQADLRLAVRTRSTRTRATPGARWGGGVHLRTNACCAPAMHRRSLPRLRPCQKAAGTSVSPDRSDPRPRPRRRSVCTVAHIGAPGRFGASGLGPGSRRRLAPHQPLVGAPRPQGANKCGVNRELGSTHLNTAAVSTGRIEIKIPKGDVRGHPCPCFSAGAGCGPLEWTDFAGEYANPSTLPATCTAS